MKNALKYYYNIETEIIHQINKKYKFTSMNKKYILCPFTRNYDEIEEIYNLHQFIRLNKIYCHMIIPNNNRELITKINSIPYVLLQIQIEERSITEKDIFNITKIKIDTEQYKKITRKNWYYLWQSKIDYIEYQITQFKKKYPLINESSPYYIGIIENCIEMLANINENKSIKTISHNRIENKEKTEDFYNPLNFIIDHRCRDLGEYIKKNTQEIDIINIINEYLTNNQTSIEEAKLLFLRIIYPSEYIDCCEKILNNRKEEKKIMKIITNVEIKEKKIKETYKILKRIIPLDNIEWLEKRS